LSTNLVRTDGSVEIEIESCLQLTRPQSPQYPECFSFSWRDDCSTIRHARSRRGQ